MSGRQVTRIVGFAEFCEALMQRAPDPGNLRLAGCTPAQERDVVRILIAFRDRRLARDFEVLQAGYLITASAPRLRLEQVFATLYAARKNGGRETPEAKKRD